MLEDMRLRLRGLVPFLDKQKRKIVYTDFKDEIVGVREEEAVAMPKMTGAQYEKKVRDYLRNHLDHIAIHRLRRNEPLTPTDLRVSRPPWRRSASRRATRCSPTCSPGARPRRCPTSSAPSSAWTATPRRRRSPTSSATAA